MNWDVIDQLRQKEMPPDESFTTTDYALRYGCSMSKARQDVVKLTSEGKLKKTEIKVKNVWVPYYTAVQSGHESTGTDRRRDNRERAQRPGNLLRVR